MIELVSVMPALKFRGRIFLSARIRAGSRFKRFLCFGLVGVRQFRIPPGVCELQVEDH
jgi:hypothetical protein